MCNKRQIRAWIRKLTKRWNLFDITFFGKFNLNFDRYYYFGAFSENSWFVVSKFLEYVGCWLPLSEYWSLSLYKNRLEIFYK
jgi:hypothetical protein